VKRHGRTECHDVLVPRGWDADEALSVCRFLQEILDAIWDVHGDQIAERLLQDDVDHRQLELFVPRGDELPF